MTIAADNGMPGLAMRITGILKARGDRPYYAAFYSLPDWQLDSHRRYRQGADLCHRPSGIEIQRDGSKQTRGDRYHADHAAHSSICRQ